MCSPFDFLAIWRLADTNHVSAFAPLIENKPQFWTKTCESGRVDNSFCSRSFTAARITPPPAEEVTEALRAPRDDRPRHLCENKNKIKMGGIQKQPESDGNCDDERVTGEAERERQRETERERERERESFLIVMFSAQSFFERCDQNLLRHKPYSSIYPLLSPAFFSVCLSQPSVCCHVE